MFIRYVIVYESCTPYVAHSHNLLCYGKHMYIEVTNNGTHPYFCEHEKSIFSAHIIPQCLVNNDTKNLEKRLYTR